MRASLATAPPGAAAARRATRPRARAAPAAGPRPPAVLLGGNVTAMPVVRSLGRRGVRVEAVGAPGDHIAHSRYCARFAPLGNGRAGQARWLEWLLGEAPRGAVVLPCSDDGLELVAHHRLELVGAGLRPVEADDGVLRAMLDKDATYAIAERIGVPAPRTRAVREPGDVAGALAGARYPCGLKPIAGHAFLERTGNRAKVLVAADPREAEALLEPLLAAGLEMQVTELVPGGDDRLFGYFTYVDERGEPLFEFTNRKLRQWPVRFGVGCYVVGEWVPDVAELGRRFVQGAGLRGIAHVEFKRDARDGEPKLIECNHRFNLAVALLCASGIDLPWLAYARLAGAPPPRLGPPRYGLSLWHPVPDARALLAYRRAGELGVAAWLGSLARPQRFSLLAADDPLPTLVHHAKLAADLLRVAASR